MQNAPEIIVDQELPVLSWLVDLTTHPKLIAGNQVEIVKTLGKLSIFEGGWDGDFEKLNFKNSANFFGSGIVFDELEITFVTPTHTLESLYVFVDQSQTKGASIKLAVSNSLSFLVQYSGIRLRVNKKIFRKMSSITEGINDFNTVVYSDNDIKIFRYVYCNFKLKNLPYENTPNKTALSMAKSEPPYFTNYDKYKDYLLCTLDILHKNVTASGRKTQYNFLTTVSSGYDSAACTALASQLGCELSLTVKTARSGMTDSGKEVAEKVGLKCIEVMRTNPGDKEDFAEAPFIVGGSGGDCIFHSFKDYLKESFLLTGFHGDKIWDIHTNPTPYFKRGDTSGSGLHEFRLNTNFINVPVPFIGGVRHLDLYRISHSDNMDPYKVGTKYDRPIPRRIVEDAGVPRGLFANQKKASAFHLTKGEAGLSKTSLKDLQHFLNTRQGEIPPLEGVHLAIRDILNASWRASNKGVLKSTNLNRKLLIRFMKGCRLSSIYLNRAYTSLWPFDYHNDLLFIWALEKTGVNYKNSRNHRPPS